MRGPDDVAGQCNAHLYLADCYGDNESVHRCALPEGHRGFHFETFNRGREDQIRIVKIDWVYDERPDRVREEQVLIQDEIDNPIGGSIAGKDTTFPPKCRKTWDNEESTNWCDEPAVGPYRVGVLDYEPRCEKHGGKPYRFVFDRKEHHFGNQTCPACEKPHRGDDAAYPVACDAGGCTGLSHCEWDDAPRPFPMFRCDECGDTG